MFSTPDAPHSSASLEGDTMAAPQLSTPSAPLPELVWVRPPQQARSQLTLSRILDAAEAILGEKSWEDASVAEIARRAGSSVGAFYTRFPDKDSLLAALHQRFIEEAWATSQAALDDKRWAGAAISDPSFYARAERLAKQMEELFVKLVVARRHEILHPIPVVAAGFVGRMVNAMLLNRLLDAKFVPPGISFVDELTHAALAYLGVFPE